MKTRISLILIVGLVALSFAPLAAQKVAADSTASKLVVVWTSGDPEVAESMVLMYTHAAKVNNWFKDVTLIIWGPSQKLLTGSVRFQEKVKKMQEDGVVVEACIACSNMLGTTDQLKACGITVKGMGTPLSNYLKSGAKVLSF